MKSIDLYLNPLRIAGGLLPAEFLHQLLTLKASYQSASDYIALVGAAFHPRAGF